MDRGIGIASISCPWRVSRQKSNDEVLLVVAVVPRKVSNEMDTEKQKKNSSYKQDESSETIEIELGRT